jgi:4-amino-4-deoxy-L-arabinose transferase-like glycosyltransferase
MISDYRNIHNPGSLYETFLPNEADLKVLVAFLKVSWARRLLRIFMLYYWIFSLLGYQIKRQTLLNKDEYNLHPKTILTALLIICVAFTLRLSYITQTDVYAPIRFDAKKYYNYASNLLHHGTFSMEESNNPTPDSYWSPGYPTLLATILNLFGDQSFYKAALMTQALLGALTAGMVFAIGSYFLPLWAAAAAGLLTAGSPHLISLGGYLLTETLFAFTLTLFLLTYATAIRTKNRTVFLSAGAIAGLCYLVNPVIFFAPLLLATFFFLSRNFVEHFSADQKKKAIQLFIAAFMVPWVIWSARCIINVPNTSPSSSNRALTNFIIGTHHDFFKIWRADRRDPNNPAEIDKQKVDESWGKFLGIFVRRILDQPGHYAWWYLYEKPRLLWSWDMQTGVGDVYVYPVTTSWFQTSGVAAAIHSAMRSVHWWLIGLSLLGALYLKKFRQNSKSEIVKTLYVCIIYVSAVYVVLQSEPRYSIPLRPLMYLCAMFGLWQFSLAARNLINLAMKHRYVEE